MAEGIDTGGSDRVVTMVGWAVAVDAPFFALAARAIDRMDEPEGGGSWLR